MPRAAPADRAGAATLADEVATFARNILGIELTAQQRAQLNAGGAAVRYGRRVGMSSAMARAVVSGLSVPAAPKPGTVGALRAALVGVPDDLEITIRATEERADGDVDVCVGFVSADVEHTCGGDDSPFLAIDGAMVLDDEDDLAVIVDDTLRRKP